MFERRNECYHIFVNGNPKLLKTIWPIRDQNTTLAVVNMNRTTSAPAPDMVFNKGSLLECSFGEGSFILNFFWNKHVSEPAQPRGPKKKEKKILQPP